MPTNRIKVIPNGHEVGGSNYQAEYEDSPVGASQYGHLIDGDGDAYNAAEYDSGNKTNSPLLRATSSEIGDADEYQAANDIEYP